MLGLFVAACLGLFLHFGDATFDGFEVFDLEFGVDDFFIAHRVYLAIYMHDVVVVEAAQDMENCIGFADIGQEFVTQPFALAGTFHQAGDVDDFDGCRDHSLRMFNFRQFVQTLVGNGNYTNVRFDRTEREVC